MAERVAIDAAKDRITADRAGIVVTFVLFGGPIGGAAIYIATTQAWLSSDPGVLGSVVLGVSFAAIVGFVIGLPPAALTGWAYASLPESLQRIAIAPFLGFLISVACLVPIGGLGFWFPYGGAGAASALVCAMFVRWLRYDIRGWRAKLARES